MVVCLVLCYHGGYGFTAYDRALSDMSVTSRPVTASTSLSKYLRV